MAGCCEVPRCNCRVVAGPGVTVDGNGSAANPYVVSGGPETPTPVQAGDTATVNTTVAGTGTAGDPWIISSDVALDPTPPGGGSNLLHSNADGLYVECADVRGCISAGDGAAYDPATGEVSARVSGDAGNTVAIGADGGLYAAGGGTVVQAVDTPTVDVTVSGSGAAGDPYEVSAAVSLDPAPPGGGGNLVHAGADGLYVECADVRGCISAGDGAAYDPATGVVSARVSGDAGNTVAIGGDGGLYAAAGSGGTVVQAGDTPTVDVTVTGTGTAGDPYEVSAAVALDPAPPGGGSNLVHAGPDGLYVECADVRGCISAGDGAAYDPATGVIEARVSGDAGNAVAIGGDGGLYAPTPAATALQVTDSPTVDLTLTGNGSTATPFNLTAAVTLDPTPPGGGTNLIQSGPDGLFMECPQVRGCISAGDGATYDAPTGEVSARLSTDAGNTVVIGGDGGIYVPLPAPPAVGCGLAGNGTPGSPISVVPAAGQGAWDWPCDIATESTLKCDETTGELWTPPDHRSTAFVVYVDHFPGGFTNPLTPNGGWTVIDAGANVGWDIPPHFAGNACRPWNYEVNLSGTWDVSYTADAVFELGYVVVIDGGAPTARPMWGRLTPMGTARRDRASGSANAAGLLIPAATAVLVTMYPAAYVRAGSVSLNSWASDGTLHTTTTTPL